MFKNMKIEINVDQPLDEVLIELERLGYKSAYKTLLDCNSIFADAGGYFSMLSIKFMDFNTTLQQLKEMQCKI